MRIIKFDNDAIEKAFNQKDINLSDIPKIDLYMDQILTLFEDQLNVDGVVSQEKILTKTMINNYSKEKIIQPIKGKKYPREQILQLICILNLKQTLQLSEIRTLISIDEETNLEQAYTDGMVLKDEIGSQMQNFLEESLQKFPIETRQNALSVALALSTISSSLKYLCEEIVKNTLTNDNQ